MEKIPSRNNQKDTDRKYLLLSLRIMGSFGAILAVPVVVFALTGKWLDARYGTRPWFLIAGFVFAAVLSAISIVRKAKEFSKEYRDIENKNLQESKKG